MEGRLVVGPWTNVRDSCPEANLVEVSGPIKMCMKGWDAQQRRHEGKPCIVYDLGVRYSGELPLKFIDDFGCSVRSYDPSKVTAEWYDYDADARGAGNHETSALDAPEHELSLKLKEHEAAGKYKLFKVAAWEKDKKRKFLYDFIRNQVSMYQATNASKVAQNRYTVKARSLATMMKNNNDTYIDVLKLEIVGSEVPFLTGALDQLGCPPVEHILVEYVRQDIDVAKGAPPTVLELEERLTKCGYSKYLTFPFMVTENPEENSDEDWKMDPIFSGSAAYCKNCLEKTTEM